MKPIQNSLLLPPAQFFLKSLLSSDFHVERMDVYHMARRVLMAEVSGWWVCGRPRLGWMDVVKVALSNRGMMVKAARQCAKDQKEWRVLVYK